MKRYHDTRRSLAGPPPGKKGRLLLERMKTAQTAVIHRLTAQLRHIGLALGGVAGARLSQHLNRPTSRNTMLRLIRTTPSKTQPTPRVLGVDDWAKRKGQRYATVLIDLERGCVIELFCASDPGTPGSASRCMVSPR